MIIRIVTGALGSITKGAKTWFGRLEVPDLLGSVQLSAILIIIIVIIIIIIIIIIYFFSFHYKKPIYRQRC